MLLNAISLLCVVLIGFAAHRASLCNVRAVAEVLSAGRAHMLWSLLQSVLWMAALTGMLVLVFGLTPRATLNRVPVGWALLGGALFGVGAAVNGGCSLSTLHRLADGDLGMLATLAGFILGVWASLRVLSGGLAMSLAPSMSPWLRWPALAPWVGGLLLAWAAWQARSLWQLGRQSTNVSLRQRLLSPTYHLSVAAALMGVTAGLLYATQGAWSYSNFLRTEVLHRVSDAAAPSTWHGVLVRACWQACSARRSNAAGRRGGSRSGWRHGHATPAVAQ